MEQIENVLGTLRSRGVHLWLENGQLRYKSPKGLLSAEELAQLRAQRSELIARLSTEAAPAAGTHKNPGQREPLSFSQLAHYRTYQLDTRSAIRQIASATRLGGALGLEALRAAIAEVVRRHDSLRTRFVRARSDVEQEVAKAGDREVLSTRDLSALEPHDRETETRQEIYRLILQPIDVSVGPLFEAQLLRLASDEHVLIIVMEHLISDAASMQIVLRDILVTYGQLVNGRALSLPPVRTQFHQFARKQKEEFFEWSRVRKPYWDKHFAGSEPLTFPVDKSVQHAGSAGWKTAKIHVDTTLTSALRDWCRLSRITPPMALFTAYVALVLHWSNKEEGVVQFESSGRATDDVANTVGYFASPLFLRVKLDESWSFAELATSVLTEYCAVYEHADFSYLISEEPRPVFVRSTLFNWVPKHSGTPAEAKGDHGLVVSPISFDHPMVEHYDLDGEPTLLMHEFGTSIDGTLYFPARRFSVETINQFCSRLLVFVRDLMAQPTADLRRLL